MTHKQDDAYWRDRLTDEQYRISRGKGTEQPHVGKYCMTSQSGVYHCVCCDAALFLSTAKFTSSCGWPSFDSALAGSVVEQSDHSLSGHQRIEVLCCQCGGHLGHVFDDGPTQTGLRYCINSEILLLKSQ